MPSVKVITALNSLAFEENINKYLDDGYKIFSTDFGVNNGQSGHYRCVYTAVLIKDEATDGDMNRPCMKLKPGLMKRRYADDTEYWLAYYPTRFNGCVEAEGKTPEEAYSNFDKVWTGDI